MMIQSSSFHFWWTSFFDCSVLRVDTSFQLRLNWRVRFPSGIIASQRYYELNIDGWYYLNRALIGGLFLFLGESEKSTSSSSAIYWTKLSFDLRSAKSRMGKLSFSHSFLLFVLPYSNERFTTWIRLVDVDVDVSWSVISFLSFLLIINEPQWLFHARIAADTNVVPFSNTRSVSDATNPRKSSNHTRFVSNH